MSDHSELISKNQEIKARRSGSLIRKVRKQDLRSSILPRDVYLLIRTSCELLRPIWGGEFSLWEDLPQWNQEKLLWVSPVAEKDIRIHGVITSLLRCLDKRGIKESREIKDLLIDIIAYAPNYWTEIMGYSWSCLSIIEINNHRDEILTWIGSRAGRFDESQPCRKRRDLLRRNLLTFV